MKKEAIVAIILGILLGLGGATFLILKTTFEKNQKLKLPVARENLTPVAGTGVDVTPLQIISPEDSSITSKNSVTLTIKTKKNDLIVVQSPVKTVAQKADKDEIKVSFPLSLGENRIQVASYPKDTKTPPQQKEIKIYYLDEE